MGSSAQTAEGDLKRTPFAHLMVYAIDRKLTGSLFLDEPNGQTNLVQFDRGAPVKVRPGDGYARLGDMLVQADALARSDLARALENEGPLGQRLIAAGLLDEATLTSVLEQQFRRRIVRLFALSSSTLYRYVDAHDELAHWGCAQSVDPLMLLWEGLRTHGDCSTKFEGMVTHLARSALKLHPQAPLERLCLEGDELIAANCLREQPTGFEDLVQSGVIGASALRRLVYALAILRQLDLGVGGTPVGIEDPTDSLSTNGNTVGRVRLVTASFRMGVAAPDPPGDGERAPVAPRRRRVATGSTELGGEMPSDRPSYPAPHPTPLIPEAGPVPSSGVVPLGSIQALSRISPVPPAGPVTITESTPPVRSPSVRPESYGVESPFVPKPSRPPRAPFEAAASSSRPPRSSGAYFQIAEVRLAANDLDGARDACERALRIEPTHPDYIALGAWIRASLPNGDIRVAAQELDQILAVNERHLKARYYRALLRHKLGDSAGALRDLRRALDVDPGFVDAARELATIESAMPKPDKAGFFGRLFRRS
jgi:hypothetical protein